MSYSAMAHALAGYVEGHLGCFDIRRMSECFGFSENYLRELFQKNMDMPIMQYYRRRKLMLSAFELLYSDRRIIDIALECGFSSHEAYTRAFRKYFGMSPSQFRLVRPSIGGRQLETGVFGPERIASEENRSDGLMMGQDERSTILYGIRKVEHGTYGSKTMYPICVKAVAEYLGDDVSYAYIMAATGAAFRLVWNREMWDLSNIDIYHTLRESNDIYAYGAKALGREFSFLGRNESTTKEMFTAYMKEAIAKGYPVIALGIIGPPEPCIIAGYEADGEVVTGWNFFQNDSEFASSLRTADNGYFLCDTWWENTDTQAVMHFGAVSGERAQLKDIIRMAADIMEARGEHTYAKGIRAYDAWKEMLLDEKWFENDAAFDGLFEKLLVHNDAMVCIQDGRKWGAEFFKGVSAACGEQETVMCMDISRRFQRVSALAEEMMELLGDWGDMEKMLQNFASRPVREKTGGLIDAAKAEDSRALEEIRRLYGYL